MPEPITPVEPTPEVARRNVTLALALLGLAILIAAGAIVVARSQGRKQEGAAESERSHQVPSPSVPQTNGTTVIATGASEYSTICRVVSRTPRTTGRGVTCRSCS